MINIHIDFNIFIIYFISPKKWLAHLPLTNQIYLKFIKIIPFVKIHFKNIHILQNNVFTTIFGDPNVLLLDTKLSMFNILTF
jgi:hypothetical protein